MKKASAAADQLIGEGSALVARHEQTLISGCGAFMRKIVDLDQRARRRVLTTSRRNPIVDPSGWTGGPPQRPPVLPE